MQVIQKQAPPALYAMNCWLVAVMPNLINSTLEEEQNRIKTSKGRSSWYSWFPQAIMVGLSAHPDTKLQAHPQASLFALYTVLYNGVNTGFMERVQLTLIRQLHPFFQSASDANFYFFLFKSPCSIFARLLHPLFTYTFS